MASPFLASEMAAAIYPWLLVLFSEAFDATGLPAELSSGTLALASTRIKLGRPSTWRESALSQLGVFAAVVRKHQQALEPAKPDVVGLLQGRIVQGGPREALSCPLAATQTKQ